MALIPNRLPVPLSTRLSSTAADILSRRGREYDLAVGSIPFLLATSPELPRTVETIPLRKDQFDNESDPGEQSLAGWWRRSQDSFHEGAGALYAESRLNTTPGNSFFDSEGVDVFTKNKVTLLRQMDVMDSAGGFSRLNTFAVNGTRTNLCTNPSLETDTTGYAGTGDGESPPTLAVSTAQVHSGAQSLKVTYQGDDTLGIPPTVEIPHDALVVGQTYTVSCWVYVPSGNTPLRLIAASDQGAVTTVYDEWVLLSLTWTAVATTDFVGIWPGVSATTGHIFYLDDVLIEQASSAQPYLDGNSEGGAWSGTANLSSSSQTIASTEASISAVGGGELWTSPDKATAFTSLHAPAGKVIVDGFIAGLSFYDVADDGTLYEGLVSSPGTATSWPCGSEVSRIAFGKGRLWACGGRNIWQPDLTLAGGTAQTAIFTNTNAGWDYTCIAEGPSAMYFGGHDGRSSTIMAIELADDGSVPTLSGARVTAVLPDGELVQELTVLAGQFMGIGTNRGFRVGAFDGSTVTYGPLLFSPEGVSACTAIARQDRFFLVAFRTTADKAVAYRIDTGTPLPDGIFPYAKDVQVSTGAGVITSLAVLELDVLAADANGLVYAQSTDTLVASGWIQTGRIRYRTNEPKLYKYVDLETEPLLGQIQVQGINEVNSLFDIGTIGPESTPQMSVTSALGPQKQMALRLTLARDSSDVTQGPVLNSFLLRAVPSVAPQRLHTLPLLCFDKEQARSGQQYGYKGFSSERLSALQELENVGDSVVFQDFTRGSVGETVVIDSIRFVQTNANGFGGILVLQLRTVTT